MLVVPLATAPAVRSQLRPDPLQRRDPHSLWNFIRGLIGTYRLTLEIDASCTAVPPGERTRLYDATVARRDRRSGRRPVRCGRR